MAVVVDRWDVMALAALLVIGWSVWTLGGAPGVAGFVGVLVLAVALARQASEGQVQAGRPYGRQAQDGHGQHRQIDGRQPHGRVGRGDEGE